MILKLVILVCRPTIWRNPSYILKCCGIFKLQ